MSRAERHYGDDEWTTSQELEVMINSDTRKAIPEPAAFRS